jgi:hypothetical protein
MPVPDPNNKKNIFNSTDENSYDADNKITNNDNPVREGQEDSSILHDNEGNEESTMLHDHASNDEPQISQTNDWSKNPEQMEEWVDTDKVNFQPED